jgi:hypothetical protein
MFESENIVRKPEVFGAIALFELFHLVSHTFRRAHVERFTVNGPRAPIAAVRTAAAGHKVQRENTMSVLPGTAVCLRLDKVASWQRKRVEISQEWPARGSKKLVRGRMEKSNARDLLGSRTRVPQ